MKIFKRIASLCFFMFCMLACTALFYSCGTDDEVSGDGSVDPDKEIPDPTGTIQIAMRNSNNGKTVLGSVYIDNENFAGGYFASLGPVRGLGNVAHIPTTGWGRQVSVIPGHGYVAYDRYEEKFYRIYVIKDLVGVSGGIIGSEIKYQAPFKGNDEKIMLDSTDLRFPFTGGQKDIVFKNSGVILFDVETDVPNWCTVQKTSTYDDSFLTNGVRIVVKAGSSTEAEHGTITLTTLYGKETVINITRSGIEPFVSFGDLEERELSAAAQTDQIDCVGNVSFEDLIVSSSASWCRVQLEENTKKIQGKATEKDDLEQYATNSYTLKIDCDENQTSQSRNAVISVQSKDGKINASFNLIQKGATFEVKIDKIGFDKNSNYRTVTINTTFANWEAESSADWCTFSKNGNQITIHATAANTDRTAIISFKGFDAKITVHQSKYAVNDAFNENGIEGTVGYIGDDSRLVYKELGEKVVWSSENVETGANSLSDGEYNMNVIKKIPFWQDSYPAFLLCEQLNVNGISGWYLPAIDELQNLKLSGSYWSSTESDSGMAYYCAGGRYRYSAFQYFNTYDIVAVHKF